MNYLLFVRNAQVAEEIVLQIGTESVKGVYNLENFEKYPSDYPPEEFSLQNIADLARGRVIIQQYLRLIQAKIKIS